MSGSCHDLYIESLVLVEEVKSSAQLSSPPGCEFKGYPIRHLPWRERDPLRLPNFPGA